MGLRPASWRHAPHCLYVSRGCILNNFTVIIFSGIMVIAVVSVFMAPRKNRRQKKYFGLYSRHEPANDLISIRVCDIVAAAYGESSSQAIKIKPEMKIDNIHFILTGDNREYDELADVMIDIEKHYEIRLHFDKFNLKTMTVGDLILEINKCLKCANQSLRVSA